MRWKILISETVASEAIELLEKNDIEVKRGRGLDEKTVLEDLQDCDAVLVRVMKLTGDILKQCPKLKVIAKHGVGCDSIDIEAAKKLGIPIVFTPRANSRSVAEHTMALILACARQLRYSNLQYAAGNAKAKDTAGITELEQKTLALIGCGRIAQYVAKMAKFGFDMNVIGFDPFIQDGMWPETIIKYEKIDSLLKDADYVSIHVPATPSNTNLMSDEQFALMKPSAYLINTARGTIVDQNALVQALNDKVIAGAGLDVCEPEPAPQDSPLFENQRVILTPHAGAASMEAMVKMGLQSAQGVIDVLNGRNPEYRFA